jgi:hypothetical protein
MLMPMLKAFEEGQFEGRAASGRSNDWRTWNGAAWGYEGFLVDNYYTLLAVLLRERAVESGVEANGICPLIGSGDGTNRTVSRTRTTKG